MSTNPGRAQEPPSGPRRWGRAAAFAVLIFAPLARADGATLAGRWSATAMRSDWNIGDWGPACGPRPGGGGSAGGAVTVRQNGGELSISGVGRSYSTTECWEQFPGLLRVGHSSSPRSWRTVCRTPPGDPRQATITTNVTATDSQINFDETGQYQFVLEGQNCTASVRRTRVMTLVKREGEAPVGPAPKQSEKPKARDCSNPGLPERLEIRPRRKLLKPGDAFDFQVTVLDRSGCAVRVAPGWRLAQPLAGVEVRPGGTIQVAADAPEGQGEIVAVLADRRASASVEVVSSERYEALLGHDPATPDGKAETPPRDRETAPTDSMGAKTGVTQDAGAGRRTTFVAIVGALALALGIVGLVVLSRSRRRQLSAQVEDEGEPPPPAPVGGPQRNLCPTCREEYPPDALFCPRDGNRLTPVAGHAPFGPAGWVCPICGQGYDPGVMACPVHHEPLVPSLLQSASGHDAPTTRKICPACGTQFGGESQFCGQCGAVLVQVN